MPAACAVSLSAPQVLDHLFLPLRHLVSIKSGLGAVPSEGRIFHLFLRPFCFSLPWFWWFISLAPFSPIDHDNSFHTCRKVEILGRPYSERPINIYTCCIS